MAKESVKRTLFGLGFGLMLIMTAEVALRLLGMSEEWSEFKFLNQDSRLMIEDDSLLWRTKPDADISNGYFHVVTNEMGFRCGEECLNEEDLKRDYRLKVFCLGGSVTFGWGVDGPETYPAQLGKMLNGDERFSPALAVNAGVMGYTTNQALLFLKEELLQYGPDVVTVCFTINDQLTSYMEDAAEMNVRETFSWKLKKFLTNSSIFLNLNRIYIETVKGRVREQTRYKSIRTRPEKYRDNLESFSRLAQEQSFRLIFINEKVTAAPKELDDYQNIMKKTAEDENIPYLNAAEKFDAYLQRIEREDDGKEGIKTRLKDADENRTIASRQPNVLRSIEVDDDYRSLFVDDWHPNAKGQKLLAGWIFDVIKNLPLKLSKQPQ